MLSKLSQKHYIDPDIFAKEQKQIFSKLWIFAGLRTLLSEPDAFLTRTIGGIPILIQNFAGEIKAFENQCAHRQAPLQLEAYGQRKLACRYHGWSYTDDGHVKGIPHQEALYHFTADEKEKLCLRQFAIEIIGNLIFINIDADPLPIEEQFTDEFRQQLTTISGYFSSQVIHTSVPSQFNWKLNFENVLDYNHIPFVHPQTFKPLINKAAISSAPARKALPEKTLLSSLSYASTMEMQVKKWPWQASVEGFGEPDTFHTHFIYPNVNFISVGGLIFLIQQFDPISASLTDVRLSLMTARETNKIRGLPAILWGYLKSEKRVLDEDRALLEGLQSNLYDNGKPSYHGAYEVQLQNVAEVYLDLMETQP